MNATPRNTRLTLLATLAGTMMLAGTAHAANGKGSRPSAAGAGDGSLPQAQYGASSETGRKYQVAVADRDASGPTSYRRAAGPNPATPGRNNATLPNAQFGSSQKNSDGFGTAVPDRDYTGPASYGRSAAPQAWNGGRDNAALPHAMIGDSAELSGPCTWDMSDRDNATLPEAEMLEAMFRDFADPFGFGTEEADEADGKSEDGPIWPSCDPMDRDADGDVDFDDFKILAAAFGTDEGDLDGDGIVTGADLGIMLVRLSTATAND